MHRRNLKAGSVLVLVLASPSFAQGPPAGAADVCKSLSFPAQPPAGPPAIKPANQSVRVLAFGDYGDGGKDQLKAAAAMATYHQNPKHPFDFGITLGDNFYPTGLNSATHPRWSTNWETPYGPLGIRLYVSLGNHDYYDSASPIAEALYSQQSTTWCLPAAYYTYTAGPIQFFALDTDSIMRAAQQGQDRTPIDIQKKWLKEQLEVSKSPWKVVYGHHPVYSTGEHQDNDPMIKEILPILKNRADVYIAGHDHDMEYLKPEGGVHFFVSGAGGHDKRALGADPGNRRLWAKEKVLGFSVLESDGSSLSVSFFDEADTQLCKVQLVKGKPPVVTCPKA